MREGEAEIHDSAEGGTSRDETEAPQRQTLAHNDHPDLKDSQDTSNFQEPGSPTTRLSVNISQDTLEALQEIVKDKGVSTTEAVRRLIGYGIIVYRSNRDGHDVLIRKGHDKIERIVVLDQEF